jgi:hypothetical protein
MDPKIQKNSANNYVLSVQYWTIRNTRMMMMWSSRRATKSKTKKEGSWYCTYGELEQKDNNNIILIFVFGSVRVMSSLHFLLSIDFITCSSELRLNHEASTKYTGLSISIESRWCCLVCSSYRCIHLPVECHPYCLESRFLVPAAIWAPAAPAATTTTATTTANQTSPPPFRLLAFYSSSNWRQGT